jgi:glyoxylate/hydroxypyruvate reductase A
MKFFFISEMDNAETWRTAIQERLPGAEFDIWPDEIGDKASYDYAIAWKPPVGELATFPNLKAILSLGAGVDGILVDTELPASVPVVRMVDRCLTEGMSEYVLYWVIHYHRKMDVYMNWVSQGIWKRLRQIDTRERKVGFLGLGELGTDAATKVAALGFDIAGWSRSPKDVANVTSFHGEEGLKPFLARTEILIVLLPLTESTRGIVNADLLAALPKDACVINAARGPHLVDEDLIAAIDDGHIRAATLDVFHTEPLPADHPFWSHPKITVTPHMASLTVASSAADWMAENVKLIEAGKPPLNRVDLKRGY